MEDEESFQYISCYSLSFIGEEIPAETVTFQYISCYSLSFTIMEEMFGQKRFNTSHVTLYPLHVFDYIRQIMFQYISCYSLSGGRKFRMGVENRFQYISCYSLSEIGNTKDKLELRFNTSHVTLYLDAWLQLHNNQVFQYISCYSLSHQLRHLYHHYCCFNTSHVTLYRLKMESL